MNYVDIDTKIEYCELQLKLAIDEDAINEFSYELTSLRFKKHLDLLKQKVVKTNSRQSSVLDLLKKTFPIQF